MQEWAKTLVPSDNLNALFWLVVKAEAVPQDASAAAANFEVNHTLTRDTNAVSFMSADIGTKPSHLPGSSI